MEKKEDPTGSIYAWKKYPGHSKDWYLELFKLNGSRYKNVLPFLTRILDLEPHSLVLNLNHPEHYEEAELEFYSGAVISKASDIPLKIEGSAVFSDGRFKKGSLENKKISTLKQFREGLNDYFKEYQFKIGFGDHLHEFFASSNLDENVIAAYSELFE